MNALLTAEMAVWVPEDSPLAQPEQALAAADRQAARLSGLIAAVALLSVLAATAVTVMS